VAKRPEVFAVYRGRRVPVFIETARGTRPARASDARSIRAAFRNPSGYPFSGSTWRPVLRLPDGTPYRVRFGPIGRKDRTKKGRARWRRKAEACGRLASVPRRLTHYRTKKQALRALLDANPDLMAHVEMHRGHEEAGLDDIRSYLEQDKRRRWRWRDAIKALMPRAPARWQRLAEIIVPLEEALSSDIGWPHGGRVMLPFEAAAPEGLLEAEAREAAKACARPKRRKKLEPAPF
jgi:hypothetical protein